MAGAIAPSVSAKLAGTGFVKNCICMDDLAKVTVTLYMDEKDKEALQRLADDQERSLFEMAVLILRRVIRQAQEVGEISP